MAGAEGDITVKEETVDDAVAAVELLMSKGDKIAPNAVFVLGHSLGGTVVPRIAQGARQSAGFVVMAGSARPLEDVVLEQVRYISSLKGEPSDEEKEKLAELERQVQRARSLKPGESVPASKLPLGMSARYLLDLRQPDPVKGMAKVERPMLFLQGERDYQVTMADWKLWKDRLKGRKDVKFILYPVSPTYSGLRRNKPLD